ncbi:hypothetical protein VA7868_03168 [Vibrio aerogenes CECT 7868]|uniref:TadE-like protein n=1 Tax=Vibrio aerogenes CECT 7868 TaxID=1216006 RepID=A0A1M5ZT46_9VIBR|nr:TadE family protein [Vibrio aerogenes]SHI27289.1 hypothetical protein VA7868_03168 [Vibrio aerogenes CECT 7868]
MQPILRRSHDRQAGIVSVETALIFPVLLFILTMFFELARIMLVITIINFSLERAVQNFRQDDDFYALNESRIAAVIKQRVIESSFNFVSAENIDLELHSFADLGELSAGRGQKDDDSSQTDNEQIHSYTTAPVLNMHLILKQNFITPLPELFDLGTSYQHEFQQTLGDLVMDENES